MDERPPPQPAKLLNIWEAWRRGESLPGRTMADLKLGGLRELLEADPDESTSQVLLASWMKWEKAQVGPGEVLAEMEAAGVDQALTRLATA